MKKVLMVVYSFPPLKNPEAERAISFIRLLHNYGWEPLVLTYESGAGTSAESDVSVAEGLDIVRTSPWVPNHLPRFIRAFLRFLVSKLFPDKERLWELFTVRKALRMAKSKGIDLVYTLSPLSSVHLIGLRIKSKYPHVPWVADLCAISAESQINPAKPAFFYIKERYERKLLSKISGHADCIVTGNEVVLKGFLAKQTNIGRENTACIVSDGHVQELSELFEKACRAIAVRKLDNVQQ